MDLGVQRLEHGLDRLDRREKVLGKAGQSIGNDFHRRNHLSIDKRVVVEPFPTAEDAEPQPQLKEKLVPLQQLIASSLLELRKLSAVLTSSALQLRDPNVLRVGCVCEMMMGSLERLELRLCVAMCKTLLLQQLADLAGFKAVRFKQSVSLLDDPFFFGQGCLACIELTDRVFEFALHLGNGLKGGEKVNDNVNSSRNQGGKKSKRGGGCAYL